MSLITWKNVAGPNQAAAAALIDRSTKDLITGGNSLAKKGAEYVNQRAEDNTQVALDKLLNVNNLVDFNGMKANGDLSPLNNTNDSIFGIDRAMFDKGIAAKEAALKGAIPGQLEAEQMRIQDTRAANQQANIASLTDFAGGFDGVDINAGGGTVFAPQQVLEDGSKVPYTEAEIANQNAFLAGKRELGLQKLITDKQSEANLTKYGRSIGADMSQLQGGTASQRANAAERQKLSTGGQSVYDQFAASTKLDSDTSTKLRDLNLANVKADNKIVYDNTEADRGISREQVYSGLTNNYPKSSWRWDSLGGQSLKKHIADNYSDVKPWIVKEALAIAGEKPNGNWFFDEGVDTATLKTSISNIQDQAKADDGARNKVRKAEEKYVKDTRKQSMMADQLNSKELRRLKSGEGITNISGINDTMADAIYKATAPKIDKDAEASLKQQVATELLSADGAGNTPPTNGPGIVPNTTLETNSKFDENGIATVDGRNYTKASNSILDNIVTAFTDNSNEGVNKANQSNLFPSNQVNNEGLSNYDIATMDSEKFMPNIYGDNEDPAIGYGHQLTPEELANGKIIIDGVAHDINYGKPLDQQTAKKLYKQDIGKSADNVSKTWEGFDSLDYLDKQVITELNFNTGQNISKKSWPKLWAFMQMPKSKARKEGIKKELRRSYDKKNKDGSKTTIELAARSNKLANTYEQEAAY